MKTQTHVMGSSETVKSNRPKLIDLVIFTMGTHKPKLLYTCVTIKYVQQSFKLNKVKQQNTEGSTQTMPVHI